jgi:hypothetical protein
VSTGYEVNLPDLLKAQDALSQTSDGVGKAANDMRADMAKPLNPNYYSGRQQVAFTKLYHQLDHHLQTITKELGVMSGLVNKTHHGYDKHDKLGEQNILGVAAQVSDGSIGTTINPPAA